MTTPFYMTTPIYYVNARPHLGHAYTTIAADVMCRFQKMCQAEVFFATGTDEHGDKIVRAAKAEGLSPRAYVDEISSLFKNLWPALGVENDSFVRTTEARHIAVVEMILRRIHDAGDIYFSEYEGLYCYGCERFYTERELADGKCPDHETAPEVIRESNYFFKMSRYQDWLIDHIKANPDAIRPERYRNEVLAFLREPLEDLCISRPKSRLQWGVTLPFDDKYVTYVWFDALVNYLTALGYPDSPAFARFWPAAQHMIAKDILKPHAIYWPIMLKAAGLPVFQHLNVHGYWNIDQAKMSKSLGNVVEPLALKDKYGLDAFRFFLMRDMVFGLDSGFSEEAMVQRINAELANDLGNLFSRVLAMTHKYFAGTVPPPDPEADADLRLGLQAGAYSAVTAFEKEMKGLGFHKALMAVWEFINRMNKCIDTTAPWVLAKKPETRPQLETVLYNLLEGLRVVAGLLYPVMPATAEKMHHHLGCVPDRPGFLLEELKQWGRLASGSKLPKSTVLFPRIDVSVGEADAQNAVSPRPVCLKPEITLDILEKIDLRVGTVLSAEPVPRARKLLKLSVDVGEERTVVAGIAGSYAPDDLVGKQVVVVVNLKPAKLMGTLSQGMLLAAAAKDNVALVTPDREMPNGTALS